MHERLGDTTYKEPSKDIPNEVKHVFLLLTPDFAKLTGSNIRIVNQRPFKFLTGSCAQVYAFLLSSNETLLKRDIILQSEQE